MHLSHLFGNYLISLTYVIDGASLTPIQNPSKVNPNETTTKDCAKPSIIQATINGALTNMIALRRPIRSQIGPLTNDPIGCATWAKLAFWFENENDRKYINRNNDQLLELTELLNLERSNSNHSHNQDDSAAVIWSVSSGFNFLFNPINDGITMDGNAVNSPKLKMIRFFAAVAKI